MIEISKEQEFSFEATSYVEDSKIFNASDCLVFNANSLAVQPLADFLLGSAPKLSNFSITSTSPWPAAAIKGVTFRSECCIEKVR